MAAVRVLRPGAPGRAPAETMDRGGGQEPGRRPDGGVAPAGHEMVPRRRRARRALISAPGGGRRCQGARRLAAGEGALDRRREAFGLAPRVLLVALRELREDLPGEELE